MFHTIDLKPLKLPVGQRGTNFYKINLINLIKFCIHDLQCEVLKRLRQQIIVFIKALPNATTTTPKTYPSTTHSTTHSAHSALPNESGCHNDAMVAWQAAMDYWNREHKGEFF